MISLNTLMLAWATAVLGACQNTTDALAEVVFSAIDSQKEGLAVLNKEIWENPEIAYQEFHAHEVLTDFLEEQGFIVTRSDFNLSTAFRAEYSRGSGRVISFNAEYDALRGMGHACGHNLIATSSVAAALGVKEALESGGATGTVILLGTPAEEGGGGKVRLAEAGAYDGIDCSLMAHPSLAYQSYGLSTAAWTGNVTWHGAPAHAAGSPWAGVNALDGFVSAYSMAGLLRQQIMPDDRIHHVVDPSEDSQLVNVIPERARSRWGVRSLTLSRRDTLLTQVRSIFDAAALATGTNVTVESSVDYWNLVPNTALSRVHSHALQKYFPPSADPETAQYSFRSVEDEIQRPTSGGSTDQGNLSHMLPAIHAYFPITMKASAHTPGFEAEAGTEHAFSQAVIAGKVLALTGLQVLKNETLAQQMWDEFNAMSD